MIKVEIKPSQAQYTTRSGVSRQGKPYSLNEQLCYVDLGNEYPVLVKITLDDGQPAYAPGLYTVHLSSFKVGQFGSLMIDRLRLVPAK